MKVEAKKLDASKVQLDIEVPQETVKRNLKRCMKRWARKPGFPVFVRGRPLRIY